MNEWVIVHDTLTVKVLQQFLRDCFCSLFRHYDHNHSMMTFFVIAVKFIAATMDL